MPAYALLLFAIGCVLGALAVQPLAPDVRDIVLGATLLLGAYASTRHASRLRVLLLVALAAGASSAALHERSQPHVVESRTARYSGVVLDRSPADDGSAALTFACDCSLRLLVRAREEAPAIGARVLVRGRLEPFDDARNPGEPSERAIERERGLDGEIADAAILRSVAQRTADPQVWLAIAHEWAGDRFRERLGEPAASIVAGELWGERSALPPDLRAEFQETGTTHILVTAGLHVGAALALLLVILGPFSLPRWLGCGVAIAAAWAFVWWSGGQLPAVRAATMATAALSARACGRATFTWNALSIAAIAIALGRPESLPTASFALSFSCVGAIFAALGPIERWVEPRIALPARLREALCLAIVTQLGTWPVTAAVFLQFTPYAVVANVAIVPCVAVTMGLATTQLAFSWAPPLAQAAANLNAWVLAWMLGVVRALGSAPHAMVPMTPAPAWCIAAYDMAFVAAAYSWRRGVSTIAIAALVVAAGFVLWPPRAIDPRLRITVLDVGQADAIVIQTPRGHTLLVDAGGRLERGAQGDDSSAERVGERVVVPFLLRDGIHAVDALLISHPHGDHAGGVAPTLRRLRVDELADSGQLYDGHAYRDAIATARASGVPIVLPRAGMEWRTDDGVVLHFIGPSMPFIGGRNAINSNSIAFILTYHHFRMLFTGDAGSESEARFLTEGIDLHADVLKVGHHGSAYGSSPQFVAAVAPRYAIVSVGRHNLFGHPAPSTLDTLRRFGATIYRTDENGAVSITTGGSTVAIQPFLVPKKAEVIPLR